MNQPWKIGLFVTAMIGLIGGVAGYAVLASREAAPKSATSQTAEPQAESDSTPSSLNVTSSSAVPLGNLPGENTAQGQPSTNSNAGQSTTPASSTAATKPVVDPKTFKTYDQYKNEKNALFGDVTVGTGATLANGMTVAVNYRGWLTDGTMFDQNISSDKPLVFKLGSGSMIPGFEQGLNGMKVGGERLIIVPPGVGYGALSHQGIPGNSVLVFDVSLLQAQN